MTAAPNPALQQFVTALGDGMLFAKVFIGRREEGYELRHVADQTRADAELRVVPLDGLRELAQFADGGAFRPLKAAPNLRSGWRASATDDRELETALNQLYPGAVADWFAVQAGAPPVTDYREFTARQTGMYRITTMLDDERAGRMIRACCHARFCLKRRLWTVTGLAPDAADSKSVIPCLEPCAVLLEFARKAMRLEQEDRLPLALGIGEMETIGTALRESLERGTGGVREADFGAPASPRRAQLLLEKLEPVLKVSRTASDETPK